MKIFASTLFVVTFVANAAFGAGFILNDHGARATGRADAVTATVTDGSAIFYNPGGLALADEGWRVYLGASIVSPTAYYEDLSGKKTSTDSGSSVTPNLYVSGKLFDFVAVGLGFNTPFGLKISWPETSPGRSIARTQSLKTFFISPVVGVNLGDALGMDILSGLGISAGFDLVPASVELTRDVLFGSEVGSAALGGTALGVGGRVGIMWHPKIIQGLGIGVAYRSPVKLNFSGDADFDINAPYRSQLPPDGSISTSITLPQSILVGLSYDILPNLQLEVDYNFIGWSSYDQVDIAFDDGTDSLLINKRYQNTHVFRVGLEYTVPGSGLDIRAGYAYDPTPIPAKYLDVSLPDADRHVVSFGASYDLSETTFVDLGFLYVLPVTQKTNRADHQPVLKGTYGVSAMVAALSFSVKFDVMDDEASAAPSTLQ